MDKKVRSRVISGCDYYEFTPLNVDNSKTAFLGECPCGQGGCFVFEEFESKEDSDTSTPKEEKKSL